MSKIRGTDHLNEMGSFDSESVKCPVCLDSFGIDALREQNLTLEHVVPKKLGGRFCTFTCVSCNNTQGSQVDSHLVQMMKSKDAMKGHRAIGAEVRIAGNRLFSEMMWKRDPKGVNEITVIDRASNPQDVLASMECLKNSVKEINLNFNFGYVPLRAYLALIRSAYLSLFYQIGYFYILNPKLDFFRNQFLNPETTEKSICNLIASLSNIKGEFKTPVTFIEGAMMGLPPCIVVVLRMKTSETRYMAVNMPMPDSCPRELIEGMVSYKKKNGCNLPVAGRLVANSRAV